MSFGRLVADHLVDRRFEPERLTEILSSLADPAKLSVRR
jgi:hypothetical protein